MVVSLLSVGGITPLPYFTTRRYENRPRESFQQRLDRLDFAGRQEEIERAQQTGLVPSKQMNFPDTIEALRELARWREGLIAPDFADELIEIREFRKRFETNRRDDDLKPFERPLYLADIIIAAQRREARFAPGKRPEGIEELVLPDPRAEEIIDDAKQAAADEIVQRRFDEAERLQGPARAYLFPVADPAVAKSGIQQYTGAQLDLLI
jgi:hypothetical protein